MEKCQINITCCVKATDSLNWWRVCHVGGLNLVAPPTPFLVGCFFNNAKVLLSSNRPLCSERLVWYHFAITTSIQISYNCQGFMKWCSSICNIIISATIFCNNWFSSTDYHLSIVDLLVLNTEGDQPMICSDNIQKY